MNTAILLAALTVFRVDPFHHVPFLPDKDPDGGVVADALDVEAAKGEFEPVSFVVNPDADAPQVDVVVSDLVGAGGAKIPAAAADVASVKVWFRPDGRWMTTYAGNRGKPTPINNLVLHDDSLVRVDWEKKTNYLRIDYADGPAYVNVSQGQRDPGFNDGVQPVRDAVKFVPFDLKAGFRQQYLVTWKVPKDAKAGKYAGTVSLVSRPKGGAPKTLKKLPLSFTVYPFELPRARTHYDVTRPYVSFWMSTPSLGWLVNTTFDLAVAERKLRALFRNMADHNADLSGCGELTVDSPEDYALRTLIIARQEGMRADPMIGCAAYYDPYGFIWAPETGTKDIDKFPVEYKKSLDGFRDLMKKRNAILDKYLGHHRCYYTSVDECHYTLNQRCYGFWNIVHEFGGYTWTDYGDWYHCSVFTDMNDVPATVTHKDASGWRRGGGCAASYAAPFTGLENPDVWRRTKGLRCWYADYDGLDEYLFYMANRWNDFLPREKYCRFGIVYWTYDGLVSTLAWEGVREGFDDVRYCTLLRQYALKGLKASDPETVKLAREALAWQDGQDPEYVLDLDRFRRETARRIMRLMAKTGPLPPERETELPPPELPPDPRFKRIPDASAGAAKIFKFVDDALKDGNRHDLALPALQNLIKDPKAAPADVVKASVRASGLRLAALDRPGAVKFLDDALARRDLRGADRGSLLLTRVRTLLTPVKYLELAPADQLAAAEQTLTTALKQGGVSEDDRFKAVERFVRACLDAGEVQKGLAFAEARLKDTKFDADHKADLYVVLANAWRGQQEWQKALRAYDAVRRLAPGISLWRTAEGEAQAAEKTGDYKRAITCYQRLLPYCTGEAAWNRNRLMRNIKRLEGVVKKTQKDVPASLNDDDEISGLNLDDF